ncbi:MAG: hypothetical protein IPH44_21915 [Myxococcales bacterium]|nr:hypothetical protein [Myxococcales bacterium]
MRGALALALCAALLAPPAGRADQNVPTWPMSGAGQPAAAQGVEGGSLPDVRDVDMFRGSFQPGIELETLPALGAAPPLRVQYDATRVDGWLGAGWDLSLGSTIVRRATGGGVPDLTGVVLDDPTSWEMRVDGQQLFVQADGTFRAEHDAFTVYRAQLAISITGARVVGWTATRDGVTRTYGGRFWDGCPDGVVWAGAACTEPVRWELTRMVDARGNAIDYEYEAPTWNDQATALRLARVYYNDRRHVIELGYEERPDARVDGRDGALVVRAHRLATITVASVHDGGRHVAHAYRLGYDPAQGDAQSLLTTVWRVPVADDGTATGAPIVVRRMEYADRAAGGPAAFAGWAALPADAALHPADYDFAGHASRQYQSVGQFIDLDRDARADYVVFNTACEPVRIEPDAEHPEALIASLLDPGGCSFQPAVFRNAPGLGGAPRLGSDTARADQLAALVTGLRWEPPKLLFADLDDDGFPEVVLGDGPGLQAVAGSAAGWTGAPVGVAWLGIDLFEADRLADIDADGRPDLVSGDQYYVNTGVAPFFDPAHPRSLTGFAGAAPAAADVLTDGCMSDTSDAYPIAGAVPRSGGFYRAAGVEAIDAAEYVRRHTSYGDYNNDGVTDRLVALAWPKRDPLGTTVLGVDYAWGDAAGACGGLNRLYLGDGRGRFTLAPTGVGGSFAWPDGPRAVSSYENRTEESSAYTWVSTAPLNHLGMADIDGSGRAELIQACGSPELPHALPDPGVVATAAGVGFGLDGSGDCPAQASALDHGTGQMYLGVGKDQTYAGFIDLDGDGLADEVAGHDAPHPETLSAFGGAAPAWSRNTRGVAQNRLTALIGAHGGRTELTWGSSAVAHHDLGRAVPVIAQITGERGTTTFAFTDGATASRERAGFGTAEARGTSGVALRWRYHVDAVLGGTERSRATVLPSGALHDVEVSMAEFGLTGLPADVAAPYFNPVVRTCRYAFATTAGAAPDTGAWAACGAFTGEPATVSAGVRLEVTTTTWDRTGGVATGTRDFGDVTDRTDGVTTERTYHPHDATLVATRLATTRSRDDAGAVREYITYPAFAYAGMDWTTALQSDGTHSRTRTRGFAGGALAWETGWGGSHRVDYTYDHCGAIATRTDALTSDGYARDARCRLIEHTTAAGLVEGYAYDDAGRVTLETVDAGAGAIDTTRHAYDHGAAIDAPAIVDVHDAGDGTQTVEKVYVDGFGRDWRTVVCRRDPLRGDAWTASLDEAYGCAPDRDGDRAVSRVTLRSAASGWVELATELFDARDGAVAPIAAPAASGRVPAVAWSGDVPRTETRYDVLGREARLTPPDGVATTSAYDLGVARTTRAGVTTAVETRGRITRTSRNGAVIRTDEVDGFGAPRTTTDATGAITAHDYDGYGRRIATTGPAVMTYGACGVPATSTRAITQRVLADDDTLTAEIDAAGNRTSYGYDAIGRAILRTGPDGATWQTAYDDTAGARRVVTTDDLGAVTTTWVDARDRALAVDYPDGTATETSYDARGRVASFVDATGAQTATTYDRLDRVVAETVTMDAVVATTRTARDARGNAVRVEDADGEVRATTYDGAGRVLRVTLGDPTRATPRELERDTYDANGRLVEQVLDGVVHRLSYDALGRLSTREDGYLAGAAPAALMATAWTYTARDEIAREVDALGQGVARRYDAAGRLIEEADVDGATTLATRRVGYDVRGLVARTTDGAGHATCTRYDAYGRVIGVKRDGLGETVTSYARGAVAPIAGAPTPLRAVTTTAPTGEVTRRFDDALGRTWVTQAPDGSLIEAQHELGLLVRTRRWGNDGVVHAVKRYDYAPASARRIAETDWIAADDEAACAADPATCSSGRVTTTYTAGGRVATLTDAQGNVTAAHYSTDGQMLPTRVELGGVTELARSYDATYALTIAETTGDASDSIVTSFRRERNLRIDQVQRSRATTGASEVTAIRFDGVGRRVAASFTRDGHVESELAWTYDRQGRVATKAYRVDGLDYLAPGRPYSFAWSYDADGRVTSLAYPSGNVVTYQRDADGWMDRIATGAGTIVAYRDRDPAGRFHTMDYAGGTTVRRDYRDGREAWRTIGGPSGATIAETYHHDPIGRLTTIARTADGVAENSYYAYDARDMLALEAHDEDGHTTAIAYTYDAAGLRTHKQVAIDGATTRDEAYSYRAGHRLDAVGGTSLPADAWDAMGRQLVDQRGNALAWGLDAQLRAITTSAGATETMLHDALGQRVARTADGVTDVYLSDDVSGQVLHHVRGDGTTQDVVRGPGEGVVAFLSETGAITPFTAGDGDGRQLIGAAASPLVERSHGAFGELLAGTAGDGVSQLGFHQTWSTTGALRIAGVRPYDPDTGRFLAPDPLLFAAAADLNDAADFYRYAHNDPVALSDSTGYAALFSSRPFIHDFMLLDGGTSGDWYGGARTDFVNTFYRQPTGPTRPELSGLKTDWEKIADISTGPCFPPVDIDEQIAQQRLLGRHGPDPASPDGPTLKELRQQAREERQLHRAEVRQQKRDKRGGASSEATAPSEPILIACEGDCEFLEVDLDQWPTLKQGMPPRDPHVQFANIDDVTSYVSYIAAAKGLPLAQQARLVEYLRPYIGVRDIRVDAKAAVDTVTTKGAVAGIATRGGATGTGSGSVAQTDSLRKVFHVETTFHTISVDRVVTHRSRLDLSWGLPSTQIATEGSAGGGLGITGTITRNESGETEFGRFAPDSFRIRAIESSFTRLRVATPLGECASPRDGGAGVTRAWETTGSPSSVDFALTSMKQT